METMKQIAVQLDDDGFPFAIVTGEQQPGQRKVIARLDGSGNLSKKERAQYAGHIVHAVNTFDQTREALKTAKEALVHTGFCCGDNCIDEIDQALAAMEAEHT